MLPTTSSTEPELRGLMTLPYPDTSTSLDWLKQVEESCKRYKSVKKSRAVTTLELATLVRMAQHDVEMSQTILEDNELIFTQRPQSESSQTTLTSTYRRPKQHWKSPRNHL